MALFQAPPEWVTTIADVTWTVFLELAKVLTETFNIGLESETFAGLLLALIALSLILNH